MTDDNDNSYSPESTGGMLGRSEEVAAEKEEASLEDLMETVGRRSFGPLLPLSGIVLSAPGISDIPNWSPSAAWASVPPSPPSESR